jgi:CheY-like chemotaxis protein
MSEVPTPRPYVILHIEDDAPLRVSLRTLLQPLGYELLSASDGPDALSQLAGTGAVPDVLLVDAHLPGEMDGGDAAQEVCRCLGHVVPTILMSGELATANMPWLPGAPMVYLWKPVDYQSLLVTLEAFARLGRFIRSRPRALR